ncbi:MAG: hypothetical protein ACYTGH_20885 [Planctomycetota bacterium]|jgi:hypothetical protein
MKMNNTVRTAVGVLGAAILLGLGSVTGGEGTPITIQDHTGRGFAPDLGKPGDWMPDLRHPR